MYKLYESINSGSSAVEAALAEAGADYVTVPTSTAEKRHLSEEYRAINPRQQIPALALPNGSVMTEGAAMLLHLADAFPYSQLAPPPGSSARAQHDRWLIFMAVNIYEGELRKAYPPRYSDDPSGGDAVLSNATTYVNRHYELLETAMGEGPYFFGDQLTMVDIYLWMLAYWIDGDWLAAHCPKIVSLVTSVRNRPKVMPVHVKHFA
ncbi:glutathione S-transferase family protein [Rhizobium sp. LjRoot254]|uniref:glutathione S-transferase family protein n=1 Tax=Rhizobium sp. LjRoot254 TaxID=3342297 RepID=UPI003ECEC1AF